MIYSVTWSVVGAVICATLADIIIADGETKKYVKGIVSLVVVIIVFSGFAKVFSDGFTWSGLVESADTVVAVDNNYLAQVRTARADNRVAYFERVLEGDGITGLQTTYGLSNDEDLKFSVVYISTNNIVIADNSANIVVNDRIAEVARQVFGVGVLEVCLDGTYL